MCCYFGVSRSGYYSWLISKPSERICKQQHRDEQISKIYHNKKGRYGAPRICQQLSKKHGVYCNVKTVAQSLRRMDLCAKAGRKFKATTNSKHSLPVAPNLLEQKFTSSKLNKVWVGDITYLHTNEGWLYLAVVIDLFSRKVVGWSMNKNMTAVLISDALKMALGKRKPEKGLIFHSDRGSQYCSKAYQTLLAKNNIIPSMSAKGNCYDNACSESFFHSMKVEAIHGEHFTTREQMKHNVFEYIEVDYNNDRFHSSINYLSPADFEYQWHQKLAS